MRSYLMLLFIHLSFFTNSQTLQHDWENYIVSVDGRPVSINVDLGLYSFAPIKERSFVIILRTKLKNPDSKGMPYPEEYATLLTMEETLIVDLGKETGAMLTGRYTQRGLREFYFYAPDTIGYNIGVHRAMKNFPDYEWLSQAKEDKKWDNYFTVLYPSPIDLLRINSRRQIEKFNKNGDKKTSNTSIIYSFSFTSFKEREQFLRNLTWQGFEIISMPEIEDYKTNKFNLQLKREAKLDLVWIEQFVVPLFRFSQKYGGKFHDWKLASE